MSDEYQLRKDIDKLIRDIYTLQDGNLRLVSFKEDSDLIDLQTIDDIIDYYNLKNVNELIEEIEAGDIDLKDYYTKNEINAILSSYVTVSYANSRYALINHTHSQYITRDEISDLDIDISTLKLVPESENPNGVMCFDRVQKSIDELDISLSADTMSNGYLKIESNLIERSS